MSTELEPKMTYAEALQQLIDRCKAELVHNARNLRAAAGNPETPADHAEDDQAAVELSVDILDWLEEQQSNEQTRIDKAVETARQKKGAAA